ncbi:hypothetical protein P43SY_002413 [Pythium insidiosum]|uniref:Uncharacterized protein n=1 Tax=Pythium insidiosum TaxID=114742 RepID=A0AAD5LGR4_PYTIN|nr:hypothetical protein P43SY_002413 [Pythium insidiosum]
MMQHVTRSMLRNWIETERDAARQSLDRELESRAALERMTQGYKDECDTLREALQIAAQAVAEATMLGFIPSDEQPMSDPLTSSLDESVVEPAAQYGDALGWTTGDGASETVPAENLETIQSDDDDASGFADAQDA